jgi:hypothetical protein
MITNFNEFLNESKKTIKNDDIIEILKLIQDKDMKDILELRDSIKKGLDIVSESKFDIISNIKLSLQKKFDDKIWNYIINRKKSFYEELIGKLNIFDLTTLDDVKGFKKIESIYLAGGMDKAKDVGAGWRIVVENEFEKYGKIKDISLPEVDLKEFGTVIPKHIVDGEYLDMFIDNSKKVKKLYDFPLLLNPVRKEVDRTKDDAFKKASDKYKTFTHKTKIDDYNPTITDINKTMTKSIEIGDEHLVRLADVIFAGLNVYAAAGTHGELQMQSFLNKPIFVWMTDAEWNLKDHSMWTFPHISKFARNEKEMKILVKTIMKYV